MLIYHNNSDNSNVVSQPSTETTDPIKIALHYCGKADSIIHEIIVYYFKELKLEFWK